MFIHSLELGHSAGTRAVKAMGESHSDNNTHTHIYICINSLTCATFAGAASKRFGIDKEREAVPLTLSVAYNKVSFPTITCLLKFTAGSIFTPAPSGLQVAVSGRSQWMQTEIVCTSINLYKACRKPEQLGESDTLFSRVPAVLLSAFLIKSHLSRFESRKSAADDDRSPEEAVLQV